MPSRPEDAAHVQTEVFKVRSVGAPLRCKASRSNPGGSQASGAPCRRSDSSSCSNCVEQVEFVFEVCSSELQRRPWCVQRGYVAIVKLQQQMLEELPGAALPRLPEPRKPTSKFRSLFKREEEEDRVDRDLAEQLETYLNTLLAMPAVGSCDAVVDFLEIPRPAPQEQLTAAETGAAAAEGLVDACCAACQACSAFCSTLIGRGRRHLEAAIGEEEEPSELGSSWRSWRGLNRSWRACTSGGRNRETGSSLHSPQQAAVREVVVPLDQKLVEWK